MKNIWIYVRVSTKDKGQDINTQLLPLRNYAVARGYNIYKEYIDEWVSWSKEDRPQLNLLLDHAKKRLIWTVLVLRFDRFSRSTRHLINTLELFNNLWIDFISYNENIDTSSPAWKVLFTMISAFAEFERNIIIERVKSGMNKARLKGVKIWRPKVDFDIDKILKLKESWMTFREIWDKLKMKKSTVFSIYKSHNINLV